MNHAELIMRRRQVRAEIDADPVVLEFTRKSTPTVSAAGGKLQGQPQKLPPQRAAIKLNKRRFNHGLVNSEAGDIPHTDYLLLGNHNLDVEKEDTFVWMGEHYHVVGIHTARTESVLASIDLLGPPNG